MPAYLVTITMPDGSQGQHSGIYADGFEASTLAQEAFPDAKRVSAQPLVLCNKRTRAAIQDWHQYQENFGRPRVRLAKGDRA